MAKAGDNYFELLRHPKWQEKRLRIMERDGFECCECGDKETTLNVHHSYYTKGAKPWEYPDESLRCLCEPCHEKRHAILNQIKEGMGQITLPILSCLRGYMLGLLMAEQLGRAGNLNPSVTLSLDEKSAQMEVQGLSDVFGADSQTVFIEVGEGGSIDYQMLDTLAREFRESERWHALRWATEEVERQKGSIGYQWENTSLRA